MAPYVRLIALNTGRWPRGRWLVIKLKLA